MVLLFGLITLGTFWGQRWSGCAGGKGGGERSTHCRKPGQSLMFQQTFWGILEHKRLVRA